MEIERTQVSDDLVREVYENEGVRATYLNNILVRLEKITKENDNNE